MRKVPVTIEYTPEGDWWVRSPDAVGFFACGQTREDALENAKEGLALFLGVDENSIELEVTETRSAEDG